LGQRESSEACGHLPTPANGPSASAGDSLETRQSSAITHCPLTHWLGLEGDRHASLDSLWPTWFFVVQRLGFTSLSLTLADGVRVWQSPDLAARRSAAAKSYAWALGVLELKTRAGPIIEWPRPNHPLEEEILGPHDLAMLDPRLLRLSSELWLKVG